MALLVLARKQNRPDDDATYKHRDEGQASETWRSWIGAPKLLVQESLVAPIYSLALDTLLPVRVWGNVFKKK